MTRWWARTSIWRSTCSTSSTTGGCRESTTIRRALESRFKSALREQIGPPGESVAPADTDIALREILDADDGPSVSTYIEREAGPSASMPSCRTSLWLPSL
jgi:hypothetical protein